MRDQGKISLTIIIIVLAVVLPMLYLGYFSVKPVPDIRNLPEFDPGKVNEVLIIAPHNDDEVLGPGGMIQKHLRDGANVRVVMMTNGDGQYRGPFATNKKKEIELGYRRQKETLNALANLGAG